MSRDFNSNNKTQRTITRTHYRGKFKSQAYLENSGMGSKCIKDLHFAERTHYGFIDHLNNSVVPDERYLVSVDNHRMFDFVADSFTLLRLNFISAKNRGLIPSNSPAFAEMNIFKSYENPRIKYGEYLKNILRDYNKTYIPNVVGKSSIASYSDYVNNFFKFFFNEDFNQPLTMTKWNTSINSSVLDTGVSLMYYEMDYDADQQKINDIIDDPCFSYLQNIVLNMSFSLSKENPNILVYDMNSPAGSSIRESYGLYNLKNIFDKRYVKTVFFDNELLYNNINIYFNRYVFENPLIRVLNHQCGKTVSSYIELQNIPFNQRPLTELQELEVYCKIRNKEEGFFYSPQKLNNIIKKAKNFNQKLDNPSAMSYINDMFRDQIWNKDYGYHDIKQKFMGTTQTESQRQQTGGGQSTSSGGGGGGSSY
tara:strand:+ start:284 stop:1552 length:1269 start_codon:yes stop_codon:yes gene_type:complete